MNKLRVHSDDNAQDIRKYHEDSDIDHDSTTCYDGSEVEDGLEEEWLKSKSGCKKVKKKWKKNWVALLDALLFMNIWSMMLKDAC